MIPGLADLRERVAELRQDAGLTQAAAADAAGVSQSFVAKLEAGESVPNYADAARLYNTLEAEHRGGEATAAEVMTAAVVTVAPGDTVAEASATMTDHGFSQLPVVADGDPVGSVTSRRLLEVEPGELVRDYMGPAFPAVPGDTGVTAVAELLDTANAVLVRENSEIDGIITAADVL
ncbi:MAG: CBS domain-containing protein [Candidatus Nanohaloarchaea archaeon]|nr:CBS domain-containing protein [Candidatus Nanohaloarchaea archaeon]